MKKMRTLEADGRCELAHWQYFISVLKKWPEKNFCEATLSCFTDALFLKSWSEIFFWRQLHHSQVNQQSFPYTHSRGRQSEEKNLVIIESALINSAISA